MEWLEHEFCQGHSYSGGCPLRHPLIVEMYNTVALGALLGKLNMLRDGTQVAFVRVPLKGSQLPSATKAVAVCVSATQACGAISAAFR